MPFYLASADFFFVMRCCLKKSKDDWIEVENPSLRIVDPELWEKAQSIADSQVTKYKSNRPRRSNRYLFSTLIRCEECGYSFRRICREYPTYNRIWWACSGRNVNGAEFCSNSTTLEEDELIDNLDRYLQKYITDKDDFIRKLENRIKKDSSQESELSDLSQKLKKVQTKTNGNV